MSDMVHSDECQDPLAQSCVFSGGNKSQRKGGLDDRHKSKVSCCGSLVFFCALCLCGVGVMVQICVFERADEASSLDAGLIMLLVSHMLLMGPRSPCDAEDDSLVASPSSLRAILLLHRHIIATTHVPNLSLRTSGIGARLGAFILIISPIHVF